MIDKVDIESRITLLKQLLIDYPKISRWKLWRLCHPLAELKTPGVKEIFAEMLNSTDVNVKLVGLEMLGFHYVLNRSEIDYVTAMLLNDKSDEVRATCTYILVRQIKKPLQVLLDLLITDKSKRVREAALAMILETSGIGFSVRKEIGDRLFSKKRKFSITDVQSLLTEYGLKLDDAYIS